MKTRKPTPAEIAQYNAYCDPLREQIKAITIANNYEGGLTIKQKALIEEIHAWEELNGFTITVNGVRKVVGKK